MSRACALGLTVALALALAMIAAGAGASAASHAREEPPVPDRALFEEIVRAEGIQTEHEVRMSEYVAHLLAALQEFLSREIGGATWLGPVARVILWTLLIALSALAIYLVARLVRSWRAAPGAAAPVQRVAALPESIDLDARIEAELARGDARAALRTLWAWLRRGLRDALQADLPEGCTNRELVSKTRARNPAWPGLGPLGAIARDSDRLMYAGEKPDVETVRSLVATARGLFA